MQASGAGPCEQSLPLCGGAGAVPLSVTSAARDDPGGAAGGVRDEARCLVC
jgi:hypothetical protein